MSTRSALTLAAALAALGTTPAHAGDASRFGYDDCTAAEAFLPADREAVQRYVPETEPALVPAGAGRLDDKVHVFVRILRCRDEAGRPVRSLWLGPLLHPVDNRVHEGQAVHLLWRLHTNDEVLFDRLRTALPSSAVRLVPSPGSLEAAFEDLAAGDVGPTTFHGGLEGTLDDLRTGWRAPATQPAVFLPEVRGVGATWYVPTGGVLWRVVSLFPQRGGGDADPLAGDDPFLNFRLGAASGELHAAPGTRLAEVMGGEQAPADSLFLYARSTRQDQCVERVGPTSACLPKKRF